MSRAEIESWVRGKSVLFLTHKDEKYIRNSQELSILSSASRAQVISADAKLKLWKYGHAVSKIFAGSLTKTKNTEVIFAGYLPQLSILPLYPLIREKEIIIDFFISLYDTIAFDKKWFNPKNPISRALFHIDKFTLHAADRIIADTEAHADYFSKTFSIERSKITVLHLEADQSIYYPRDTKKEGPYKDKFMVLYFGTVLPLQGVDVVLSAARQLESEVDIQFCFIGPLDKKLRREFHGLKNVTFIDWLSQEKLADLISMSDLCLAGHFHATIEKARRVIAGKTYIYRAMKKPMVLGENKANRELFNTYDPDIHFVEMGSAVSLSNKILQCAQKWRVIGNQNTARLGAVDAQPFTPEAL